LELQHDAGVAMQQRGTSRLLNFGFKTAPAWNQGAVSDNHIIWNGKLDYIAGPGVVAVEPLQQNGCEPGFGRQFIVQECDLATHDSD